MKIARNETAELIPGIGTVHFEPLTRSPRLSGWHANRTHSQRFRFESGGREYWGEIVRTYDKSAPQGVRTSVEADLMTRVADGHGGSGRRLPETAKRQWREKLIRAFKRNLHDFLDQQTPEDCARVRAAESLDSACAPDARRPLTADKPFRVYLRTPTASVSFEFPDLPAARAYIAGQIARNDGRVLPGGAPAGPGAVDPMQTHIVWKLPDGTCGTETLADFPWGYRPDPERPFGGLWTIPADGGVEIGVTGPDWQPDAATRFYAQRDLGNGRTLEAFGDTPEAARNALLAKEADAPAETISDEPAAGGLPEIKVTGTIDLTPKWAGLIRVFVAAIRDGTDEGRRIAIDELNRLAAFADEMNARPTDDETAERIRLLEAVAVVANETAHCIPPGMARDEMNAALAAAGWQVAETPAVDVPADAAAVIAVPAAVPWQRVADIMTGALETAGLRYWLDSVQFAHDPAVKFESPVYADPEFWRHPSAVMTAVYDDPDSPDGEGNRAGRMEIRTADIVRGLRVMAEKEPSSFADLVAENDDAATHDVFMQCLILGSVVYG